MANGDFYSASSPVVFGDSIGVRAQMGYKIAPDTSLARTNAAPKEILSKIANYQGDLNGQDVVLSSGTNDTSQIASILPEQIALLKQKGAGHIFVLGVSNQNHRLLGANDGISDIATEQGATYIALPDTSGDPENMHPAVADLHNAIAAARAKYHSGVRDLVYRYGEDAPKPQIDDGVYRISEGQAPPAIKDTFYREALSKPHTELPQFHHTKEELPPMTTADTHAIQEALIKENIKAGYAKYNLGSFGRNHDGDDGVRGNLTSQAIRDYERDHKLGNLDAHELIAEMKKNAPMHSEPATLPTSASHATGKGFPGATLRKI